MPCTSNAEIEGSNTYNAYIASLFIVKNYLLYSTAKTAKKVKIPKTSLSEFL